MVLLQAIETVTDTIDTIAKSEVVQNVTDPANFGIFQQLTQYGALGIVVLALGALAWYLFKRQLDASDKLAKKIEEMEEEQRKTRSKK